MEGTRWMEPRRGLVQRRPVPVRAMSRCALIFVLSIGIGGTLIVTVIPQVLNAVIPVDISIDISIDIDVSISIDKVPFFVLFGGETSRGTASATAAGAGVLVGPVFLDHLQRSLQVQRSRVG